MASNLVPSRVLVPPWNLMSTDFTVYVSVVDFYCHHSWIWACRVGHFQRDNSQGIHPRNVCCTGQWAGLPEERIKGKSKLSRASSLPALPPLAQCKELSQQPATRAGATVTTMLSQYDGLYLLQSLTQNLPLSSKDTLIWHFVRIVRKEINPEPWYQGWNH